MKMNMAIIALTKNGLGLACKIRTGLGGVVYGPATLITAENQADVLPIEDPFRTWVGKIFKEYRALLFIMASGIVVRSIAPYLQDKTSDPAVLVMDEKGGYVISLLSGHWGGANELAREVATFTQGQPVLTTATDVNQLIAFDVFARHYDCVLENPSVLKKISGALVNGETVTFFSDCPMEGALPGSILPGKDDQAGKYAVVLSNSIIWQPQFDTVLYIRPRNLILGIGCKKGIAKTFLEDSIIDFLKQNRKSPFSVKKLSSIDLKANEPAILDYSKEKSLPYLTIPPEKIRQVENQFQCSLFVKQTVGVGSVAEACAVLGGEHARLVVAKTVYPGLTLALAEEEKVYRL